MEEIKKEFEEPVVEKVEFDFSDRIAASGCGGVSAGTVVPWN